MEHSEPIGQPSDAIRLDLRCGLAAVASCGTSVLPRGRKAQAILCYLALGSELRVPRRRLIDLLWSTREVEQGQASLRQSLMELRTALSPVAGLLTVSRDAISLDRGAVEVDFGPAPAANTGAADPGAANAGPRHLLETLRGLDRRFDAWIDALGGPAPSRPMDLRRRVLTVEPLSLLGIADAEEFCAPALTQELVTALVRHSALSVRCSPEKADCDYRLQGYLMPCGSRLRIVLHLMDERDGQIVIWSHRRQVRAPLSFPAITGLATDMSRRIAARLAPGGTLPI